MHRAQSQQSLIAALWLATLLAAFAVFAPSATGQEAATEPAATEAATEPQPEVPAGGSTQLSAEEQLRIDQERINARYKYFEEVLLRMAELTAGSDPARAALLRRAVARSKERLISVQFDDLVELIAQDRLAAAQSHQKSLEDDLGALLELLLSEERGKRLKDEQASIKEQIRRLKELINKQLELQGRTAGQGDLPSIAEGQQRLSGDTQKLSEDMRAANDTGEPSADGAPQAADGQPFDDEPTPADAKAQPNGKPGEPQNGEKTEQPNNDQKAENEQKPSDESGKPSGEPSQSESGKNGEDTKQGENAKPGESGEPSEGEPSEGQPSQQSQSPQQPGSQGGQPQPGGQSPQEPSDEQQPQQPQPGDAAQEHVEQARQRMQRAIERLKEAERKGAVEEQEQAVRELEQAKAELEEILRQLREEEMERLLAMLEERFRQMLLMQREVYDSTQRLDTIPAERRDRDHTIEAGRLSRRESMIIIEAEKALTVLRDEGTAVAFPEAVEQMIDDMDQVVVQLGRGDVGRLTQVIEEDIIAALEEMIEALKQAQEDLEQQQQQESQPMMPDDPSLIDQLAELRMIRSLQQRVNRRTVQLNELLDAPVDQAVEPDLLEQLQELSDRQERIHRATRDIVLGRNQ